MKKMIIFAVLTMFLVGSMNLSADPPVKLKIKNGKTSLRFHGKGLFSIKVPGLKGGRTLNMTIKEDPQVYINGKFIGFFPSKTVRIIMKDFDLICSATRFDGNVEDVWLVNKRDRSVTWIKGVNSNKPQRSTIKGFDPRGLELWMRSVTKFVIKRCRKKKKWIGVVYKHPVALSMHVARSRAQEAIRNSNRELRLATGLEASLSGSITRSARSRSRTGQSSGSGGSRRPGS